MTIADRLSKTGLCLHDPGQFSCQQCEFGGGMSAWPAIAPNFVRHGVPIACL